MVASVKDRLFSTITAQNEAIDLIARSLGAWQFKAIPNQINEKIFTEALVMVFVGPTGVGKTESAVQLANSLLIPQHFWYSSLDSLTTSVCSFLQTCDQIPAGSTNSIGISSGILRLHGSEYSETSSIFLKSGVGAVRLEIRQKIVQLLQFSTNRNYGDTSTTTGGCGVVIIDEVHLFTEGSLEEIVPMLAPYGHVSVTNSESGETIAYSTTNLIFIFISDLGADSLIELLLRYEERKNLPLPLIRSNIKDVFNKFWGVTVEDTQVSSSSRRKLELTKLFSEVIPFFPLERTDIKEILRVKIAKLSLDFSGRFWFHLSVSEEVLMYLSGPPFIKYTNYSQSNRVCRSVLSEGDESQRVCGFSDSSEGSSVCDSQSGVSCSMKPVSKVFAEWGTRSIEQSGPFHDLKGLISKHMAPFHIDKVLHVGLASINRSGGAAKNIIMQWCVVDDRLWGHGDLNDRLRKDIYISTEVMHSDLCETVWYGLPSVLAD